MSKEKPKGMRIGESVFCAGYLAFALVASLLFLSARDGAHAEFATTCAVMTILLGCGDAFHLVPRIIINLKGAAHSDHDERTRSFWLGLGNLVSSVTMTVFYVLLPSAMEQFPGTAGTPMPGGWLLDALLAALALVRIVLCLFPQNRWFDGQGSQRWGIYRNVPFAIMGVITVFYLANFYHAWLLAGLVAVSFVCYLEVVLRARSNPMVGMLMIPKTVCYIWMIALFLQAL